MALQLGDLITAARDRHPAFAKQRCPDAVFARYTTDYQRTLVSRATARNPSYLAQVATIVFAVDPANAAGTVGAGTGGGLPGVVDNTGTTLSLSELPVGQAVALDTENAVTLVSSSSVASATATTLTALSAAWGTNAYVGDLVQILAGPGQGQVRNILSNTATQLTVAAWGVQPTNTSLFAILSTVMVSNETDGVVTQLPATSTRQSYLIRLDSLGVPYLDLTQPLVATFDVGIQLPPQKRVLGGTVRFVATTDHAEDLSIIPYQQRLMSWGAYACYMMNNQLFLCGQQSDWNDVSNIDLRYVPEPPALTNLTDYLLLPDSARPTLVARMAYMAGVRINGMPDIPQIDVQGLASEVSEAETAWLSEIGAAQRSHTRRVREVW